MNAVEPIGSVIDIVVNPRFAVASRVSFKKMTAEASTTIDKVAATAEVRLLTNVRLNCRLRRAGEYDAALAIFQIHFAVLSGKLYVVDQGASEIRRRK